MNSNDWHKIIATVAPVLATALGGPLAGVAVGAIAKGILPDGTDPTPDNVAAAVMSATPDTLIKLKQIELDFAKSMSDAGIKLEEIAANDRDSARKRDEAVKDYTTSALGYAVTVGFFGVLGYLLIHGKPETGGDALLVMLGSLGGAWSAVISFFYGSSASSQTKTEGILSALQNKRS